MGDAPQYDDDHYSWCLDQAVRLRDLSRFPAFKDNGVDWEHVAQEIEDLGHEQRCPVEASLTRAMMHLVQLAALPDAPFGTGWRKEIRKHLDTACDRY